MAAAPIPFTLAGELSYPPDDGQPAAPQPFSVQQTFEHEVKLKLELTGSDTKVVGFGSLAAPGAKAILIEVDKESLAPVNLRFNGGSDDLEVSPGGFHAQGNPAPSAGITALSIVHTQDATVRVRILG